MRDAAHGTVNLVVAPRHHHYFDFADYLRVEEDSEIKHEFADGHRRCDVF